MPTLLSGVAMETGAAARAGILAGVISENPGEVAPGGRGDGTGVGASIHSWSLVGLSMFVASLDYTYVPQMA